MFTERGEALDELRRDLQILEQFKPPLQDALPDDDLQRRPFEPTDTLISDHQKAMYWYLTRYGVVGLAQYLCRCAKEFEGGFMKGDSWKHVYEHEDEVTELLLSVDYRYLEEFICGDLPSRVYGSPGWDVRATKAFEVAFEPTNAPGAYINTLCEKEYVQDPEAASNDSAFELNPAFATAEGGGGGGGVTFALALALT